MNKLTGFGVLSAVAAIVYYAVPFVYYSLSMDNANSDRSPTTGSVSNQLHLFTKEELARYVDAEHPGLYLSILGQVYDVSKGASHYGSGGTYSYFTGRDASVAFITGDYSNESPTENDLNDLSRLTNTDILGVVKWTKFYAEKYVFKGRLIGRFYDKNGDETQYLRDVVDLAKEQQLQDEQAKKLSVEYPPCNVLWTQEEGTKVWCTPESGGIKRSWAGVPRKYFSASSNHRCACSEEVDKQPKYGRLDLYEGCDPKSTVCYYQVE